MKLLDDYNQLVLDIMKAIIANPNYEFRQEDKKPYFDRLNQTYDAKMRYELTVLEAYRFADALISVEKGKKL